jgi:methylaspartate ammonia-lyase
MFLCDSNETVADMTESWSTEDADNAVLAISIILKRVGALPHVLLNA